MRKDEKKDVIINFAKLKPNLAKKNPGSSRYKATVYGTETSVDLPYISK